MKKIYGDRICPVCRGIVHGEAYRTKIGSRRRYFDTLECVISYFSEEFHNLNDIMLCELALKYCVEKVEVVTK